MNLNPLKLIPKLLNLGVEPNQIARPGGTSRRDFLKACGITAVSVSVPGILEATAKKPEFVMGVDWGPELDFTSMTGLAEAVDGTKEVVLEQQLSHAEMKILNDTLFEKLASRDPAAEKRAIDAVNDFTRMKMREDGFFRRIMPPVPIDGIEIGGKVYSVDTPKPKAHVWVKGEKKPEEFQQQYQNNLWMEHDAKFVNQHKKEYMQEFFAYETVGMSAGVFNKDMIAQAKKDIPNAQNLKSTPAEVENPFFKMWVEGTHDNKAVAAAVARRFDDRPATPEQITEFLDQLLAQHAARRPGRPRDVRGQLDRNGQGRSRSDRRSVPVRRRAISSAQRRADRQLG
jgi:hypothetical protein